MNRYLKSLLSFLLCVSLCMGFVIPAMAANESNQEGITFSATLDNETIFESDQAQTVTMTVTASTGMTLEAIGGKVIWDNKLILKSIDNSDSRIDYEGSVNLENGAIVWDGTAQLEQLSDVSNLAVVQFEVPANTSAGTYQVGIQDIVLSRNYGDPWEKGASATATLTIQEAHSTGGYTAGISTTTAAPNVGEQVSVYVTVDHSSDDVFAAAGLELTYDSAKLQFTGSSLDDDKVESSAAGKLKIGDYGENKSFGENGYAYALYFKAIADGQAEVTLDWAGFSDKAGAIADDLTPATLSPAAVSVTISKCVHNVTLPDHFEGPATVVDGEDYTFHLDENYTCDTVTATVSGEARAVIQNADGSYTVENVTGPLVISGTAQPKSYDVTINGPTTQNDGDTATYGTPYTFTLPADVPAESGKDGISYTVAVTIDGESYTGYTVDENRKYTIPGADLLGDLVITVTIESVAANQYTVTIIGDGAGDATAASPVNRGETSILTLAPEAGYSYTVTVTMGGDSVDVTIESNTYTVSNVTGNVVYTVTKTLVTTEVSVEKYVTLNGNNMWLVLFQTTLADGKAPAYDGQTMFWSEKYDAYCCLVIAPDIQKDEAQSKIQVTNGEATAVDYGKDVNLSGKVDANDAQLTYDIYNALYADFSEVSMERFLRADVNGTKNVDSTDAVAIVSYVLNPNA